MVAAFTFLLIFLCFLSVSLAWDAWTMPVGDQLDDGSDKKPAVKAKADNRPVSFLYLVGLDDLGRRDIAPVLATIAGSCDYRVEFKSQALQTIMRLQDPSELDKQLSLYLRKVAETSISQKSKTIIIDQLTLPRSGVLSNSSVEQETTDSAYTLQKLYKRGLKEDVNIKFLYLKRDFYETIASYSQASGGTFEDRAKNLRSIIRYLGAEHSAISSKRADPWAAVHYDWFANMRNCKVLVSAIIDFAGWDQCDVEYACQALKKVTFTSLKPAVVEEDYKTAQAMNVDTDIPVLELWQDRVYQFTPWKVPAARAAPVRSASTTTVAAVATTAAIAAPRASQRVLPEQVQRPVKPSFERRTMRSEPLETTSRRSIEPSFDRRTVRGAGLDARLRGPHLRRAP
jgi:hypothetical protein